MVPGAESPPPRTPTLRREPRPGPRHCALLLVLDVRASGVAQQRHGGSGYGGQDPSRLRVDRRQSPHDCVDGVFDGGQVPGAGAGCISQVTCTIGEGLSEVLDTRRGPVRQKQERVHARINGRCGGKYTADCHIP